MKIKNVNESEDANDDGKIHTNMTPNNMKEWMQKSIVNESEEYAGI